MKFQRDTRFDADFDKIPELIWYPYVGKRFGETGSRIMVFAHNIYIDTASYGEKTKEWADKATWADCVEEYTYVQGWWTEAFRYFIKGAVGLNSNFGRNSDPLTKARVDDFVEQIAYLNFIQGLVSSDAALTLAESAQIEASKRINKEILRVLDITHCICWGKPVYDYVQSIPGYKCRDDRYLGKRGFSSCLIEQDGGKVMRCLRIHHPSMPRFGALSPTTHTIIRNFLEPA